MRTPLMYRLEMPDAAHVPPPVHTCEVAVQVAPLSLLFRKTMPLWKPPPVEKLALHGPHQAAATYCTPPMVTASTAVTSAAALAPVAVRTSKMLFQSVALPVPAVVPAMPASELQTKAPPATRCCEFVRSIPIGAMK